MKLLVLFLLILNPIEDLNKVAEINGLKKEAKAAYTNEEYGEAVAKYEKLVNEYNIQEEAVLLNLANAYYKNNSADKALELYNALSQSANKSIASAAYNQLGLLSYQNQQKEEAINYFKGALQRDATNEEARFNYIKLKKEIEEEKNQENKGQNKDKNQDKQNKDKQNKEDKGDKGEQEQKQQEQEQKQEQQKEQEEKDKKPGEEEQQEQNQEEQGEEEQDEQQQSTAEKLEEMNMSEEKAQMILEAMKNNEIQYIQQNQRKPRSQSNDGKPDW